MSQLVETVENVDILGANVMEGHYPDGSTEVRIGVAGAITPEEAALDVHKGRLPVDVDLPETSKVVQA